MRESRLLAGALAIGISIAGIGARVYAAKAASDDDQLARARTVAGSLQ